MPFSKRSPEVFFCSVSDRGGLAEKMRKNWLGLGVNLRLLTPKKLGCSDFDFQKLRRAAADVFAKNEIYLLVDDDCEPITAIDLGLQAMESHPEFAIISAFPANCNIGRWTPENYEPFEDMSVTEHHDVGGIRICRRGSMVKGWPEQTRNGYDPEHCEQLRACGFRVGYSQHFRMIHHGENNSSIWGKTLSKEAVHP